MLAFEAAGLTGPLGKISAGLLQLGGGSALMLGAVAGIGAIAAAYKLASAEATKLAEMNTRLNQTWTDMVSKGNPIVALRLQQMKSQEDLTKAEEERDRLSTRLGIGRTKGTAGEIAQATINVDAARRNVQTIGNLIAEAQQTAREKASEEFLRAHPRVGLGLQAPLLAPSMAPMDPRLLTAPGRLRGAQFFPLEHGVGAGDETTPSPEALKGMIAAGVPGAAELLQAIKDTNRDDRMGDKIGIRIASSLPMLFSSIAGGRAGEAIAGSGGLLSSIGMSAKEGTPLAGLTVPGMVLSGIGSLFSLFSGGQHKVSVAALDAQALQQLKDLGASIMPPNFSIVEVGGGGSSRDAAYQLGRRTRLDQNPRLPYSVG